MEWDLLEWSQGSVEAAWQVFLRGASVPLVNQHPLLYEAWSRLEAEARDRGAAGAGAGVGSEQAGGQNGRLAERK